MTDKAFFPELMILGAPKCGTSTLHARLTAHPDIAGPRRKEPFFLIDEDNPLLGETNIHHHGLDAYRRLYDRDAMSATTRLDATTHALYSETAMRAVADHRETRLIVALREPAARILSSFNFTKHTRGRIAKSVTFADYIDAVDAGTELFPEIVQDRRSAYVLARDLDYSRYGHWLSRWVDAVGIDRLKVVFLDDLETDTEASVRDLLGWLGHDPARLPPADRQPFNETYSVSARGLHRAMTGANARLRLPGVIKEPLKHAYLGLQRRGAEAPERPDLSRLSQRYTDDLDRLERVISRPVPPAWRADER